MAYGLISDGNHVPLGYRKYLISPHDLAGLDVLPELARLGIASLKIEGRLKSPEYVANITRIYRQALDSLVGKAQDKALRDGSAEFVSETSAVNGQAFQYDMEMAFSRGLYTGWF